MSGVDDFDIFRFPSLANVRAHLYGAGSAYLEDLSEEERRGASQLRSPRHQRLGLTRAALNSGVRDREAVFRSVGYPPRVYISYRWESDEIKSWAAELARYIEHRGFRVFLDQDIDALEGNNPVEIGHYISVLVDCAIIVCIVTPQYLAGLVRRAWLFEERQLMNLMARRGAVIVRVLRDGQKPDPTPSSSFLEESAFDEEIVGGVALEVEVPDQFGFVVDMRGSAARQFGLLDRYFTYEGPTLPPEADRPFREWLDEVAQALSSGNVASVNRAASRGDRFEATTEYQRLLAHVAHRGRNDDSAVKYASQALADDNASVETLIDLSLLINDLGHPRIALRGLARLPWWLGEEWSWMVHFLQGDILDDLSSYVASLAHLQHAWALSVVVPVEPRPTTRQMAVLRNTLGYVLLFRFGAPREAKPHLEASWEADPVATTGVNLLICCAALGDYPTAKRLWRVARSSMTAAEHERFAEIPQKLTARTFGEPMPVVALPGADPDCWECLRCAQRLVMPDTAFLCAGCGTAFQGTSCPCCGGGLLAGAGHHTRAGEVPPKCPICNVGERMLRSMG